MVTQYPHTITFSVVATSAKDDNGNWITQTPQITQRPCRYEPKSGNGFVLTADGEKVNYDGIVYMSLPQGTIAPGTTVEIKNGAEVLLKNTVKRFSAGQLNARIWL